MVAVLLRMECRSLLTFPAFNMERPWTLISQFFHEWYVAVYLRFALEVQNARDKRKYNSYRKTSSTKVVEDVLLRGYHFVWWKTIEN